MTNKVDQNGNLLLKVDRLCLEGRRSDELLPILKEVSFSIDQGELLALVGESGSGKSMSSYAISGLLPSTVRITSGSITLHVDGVQYALDRLSQAEFRKLRGPNIGFIFQEPMTALNPTQTCGQQVAEMIQNHRDISSKAVKQQVIDLFKKVKLPRPEGMYDAYPHQLSGGQKQRVVIAIAMALRPQLLIADEPTTALDVTVQKEILMLLRELQQQEGMSILFITHDLGVVRHIADRVAVLYKGEVVEQGAIEEIFNNAQHPYTKGLLACRPSMKQRLHILPTVKDFLGGKLFKAEVERPEERQQKLESLYSEKPLLEIKSLDKWFVKHNILGQVSETVKAVNDVSFAIYPGETKGLVGESGCGKTTLSRSLLMLEPPQHGEIFYQGKDITKLNSGELRRLRKDLQIIFQDPYASLNPRITVGSAILEPMKVHGIGRNKAEREQKVISLLEKVGLSGDDRKRYPHEFSGGQRQRIGIARALAVEPKFIICDESVSALDVSVQAQVLNLLNSLKEDYGFTYLFISHDLGVVKHMSDEVVVMRHGEIVERGEADALYAHQKEDYTRNLIDSVFD